jgi:uncharacterized protein (DUF302 family)
MNKKIVFSAISGLVFGILLTLVVVYKAAPGLMLIENEIHIPFDQAVEKYTKSVEEHGWTLAKTHDLQASMTKFGKSVRPVKVFEICHPEHANKVLSRDDERIVASLMPCRVAIYERSNGKVYASSMNTKLMGGMMKGIIPEVMKDASNESAQILSVLN